MALNAKQKEIRDRMVDNYTERVQDKRAALERLNTAHNNDIAKLQEEIDREEILKLALESLK
jgi:hypothetical protein